jgi:hypothetical protein
VVDREVSHWEDEVCLEELLQVYYGQPKGYKCIVVLVVHKQLLENRGPIAWIWVSILAYSIHDLVQIWLTIANS